MLDKLDKLNDSMTVGKCIKCNRSRQSTSCEQQGYIDDLQRYLKTRYTYSHGENSLHIKFYSSQYKYR